jgi:hypothetical protein
MRKSSFAITLSPSDQAQMEAWESAQGTPQQVALHCRIVLLALAGEQNQAIAARLGISRPTVNLCNAPRISREVLPLGFVVKREAVPGCRRGLSACWSVAVLARSGGGLIPGCAQAVLRQ